MDPHSNVWFAIQISILLVLAAVVTGANALEL
jgi:hypothetical protein